MNIFWYQIRSWHAATPTRALTSKTFCGRMVPVNAQWATERPSGKSCESCLRIIARMAGE